MLCIMNHEIAVTAFCEQTRSRLCITNEYPAICHRSELIGGRASGAEDFETLQAQGNEVVSLFWGNSWPHGVGSSRGVLSPLQGRGVCSGYPFPFWKE